MNWIRKVLVVGACLAAMAVLPGYQQKMGGTWSSPDTMFYNSNIGAAGVVVKTPTRTMTEYTVTYTLWAIGSSANNWKVKKSIETKHVLSMDTADTLYTTEYLSTNNPSITRHFNMKTTGLVFNAASITDSIMVTVVYK